jgi:hypothetical protein
MPLDLADDEKAALIDLLRDTIDRPGPLPAVATNQAAAQHPRKAGTAAAIA